MKKVLLTVVALFVPSFFWDEWAWYVGYTLAVLIVFSPVWLPTLLIVLGLRHRDSARRTEQPVYSLWKHIGLALRPSHKPRAVDAASSASASEPTSTIAAALAQSASAARPAAPPSARPKPVSRPTQVDDDADMVGTSIEFTYMDQDGEVTTRRVDVHVVTDYYIRGYCRKRRATRTFRLDRVIGELLDLETGELIKPQAWRDHITRSRA